MVTVNHIQEQKAITGSKKASELMDFSRSELSTDELIRIKALIDKYDHVFSKNEHDYIMLLCIRDHKLLI